MKIQLKNLILDFEGQRILDHLNITFEKNSLNCLLGKSGSGKTSVLKIIAGISPSFKGEVYFNNEDYSNLSPKKRNIGWVPQQQLLFPGMNVYNNIGYGLVAKGLPKEVRKKRIIEVAKLVGLEKFINRTPDGLSGGERQRVALARALAPSPKVLLLDEPFSSLDAPERDRLALLFREVQLETGVTTIHVTHSAREAELISDKVYVLSNGIISQYGAIDSLYSQPVSIEVASILGITNVVKKGTIDEIKSDIVIPPDSIELNAGHLKAKVLSISKQKIYLIVENKIRLEAICNSWDKIIPGSEILIKFDPDKFVKIEKN